MPTLSCTGRDGAQRTFDYRVTQEAPSGAYSVRVSSRPLPASGEVFELTLTALDSHSLRVEMAHHHGQAEYVAMGIPEALLPILKQDLGKAISSSPTQGAAGVYRTAAATKYWERLRLAGGARYDPAMDIYVVV